MTRAINNRRRNQTNRNKLAALAKKAKKERNRLGLLRLEQALIELDGDRPPSHWGGRFHDLAVEMPGRMRENGNHDRETGKHQ